MHSPYLPSSSARNPEQGFAWAMQGIATDVLEKVNAQTGAALTPIPE